MSLNINGLFIDLKVGPKYGRKMITGLMSSRGIHVSQQRVGESLSRVSPAYQEARSTATAHQTNPVPYSADNAGHKLHVDQNEKLVMYGVTPACGSSGRIQRHDSGVSHNANQE